IVSGFLTSPCDHERIISGDAIEMRIALNASGFLGFSKMPKRSSISDITPWPLSPLWLLEQLHVQAERLELLDHNVERLGQSGFERVLTLDDRFIHSRSSRHVVGFNREHLLQCVRRAVCLERPHFHLAEPLPAELRLAAKRLLRDQAVGSS